MTSHFHLRRGNMYMNRRKLRRSSHTLHVMPSEQNVSSGRMLPAEGVTTRKSMLSTNCVVIRPTDSETDPNLTLGVAFQTEKKGCFRVFAQFPHMYRIFPAMYLFSIVSFCNHAFTLVNSKCFLRFCWPRLSNGITMENLTLRMSWNISSNALITRPWNFIGILTTVIGILVVISNGTTLFVFLKDYTLRQQSFNILLMYLLISNILYAILQSPLEIINYKYSYWWLGRTWCIVYYYSTNVLASGSIFTHLLITLNRVWAVRNPLSYRRAQSPKMALLFCAGLWTYVHLAVLPDMIQKILLMQLPLEVYGCGARYPVRKGVQLLTFLVPLLVVILAYPYIVYKLCKRTRRRIAALKAVVPKRGNQSHESCSDRSRPIETITHSTSEVVVKTRLKWARSQVFDHAFVVLTLLTASVLICWTPITLTFLTDQVDLRAWHFKVVASLFAFQPALDPLLFAAGLRDLRRSFRNTMTCK